MGHRASLNRYFNKFSATSERNIKFYKISDVFTKNVENASLFKNNTLFYQQFFFCFYPSNT